MHQDKPWLRFYDNAPSTISYPQLTLYQAVMETVCRNPDTVAYDFFGTKATYRQLGAEIDQCADALADLGMGPGDRITIAMPTCPQAIICFYGANKLGVVASMIHPLSPPKEIAYYLNISQSRYALTLDAFYSQFKQVQGNTQLTHLILARIPDYLKGIKRMGFKLTKGRKIKPVPHDPLVTWWQEMMTRSCPPVTPPKTAPDDLAVILYSGGTTGTPKGIMLSNMNFIAEGMMVSSWADFTEEDSILAILPVFHGFGLGVCVNAAFMGGAKSILVPQFTPQLVAKLIKKERPSFVVGVPTLYDALSRDPLFKKADLSCLKATFSGADTLPRTVKERFERIVKKQGGNVQLMEGYGLTEAVTAIMAMPLTHYRENSIGIPFPDMSAKVVNIDTDEEAPIGEEGELCLNGPAVMMGYLDQPAETAQTLRRHSDGHTWLHTGDIATMDADGFFYFKLRLKRMIKSSGMNVYPAQVEHVLYDHPQVKEACVIGVPDEAQVERVKGFVVLKDMSKAGPEMEQILIDHCREHLIKWSCPREIEFRSKLPQTLVGKIAFNVLLQEEVQRLRSEGKYVG